MGDFRLMPLFQDGKFWVKNVGARAHLQQWLLRPCSLTYSTCVGILIPAFRRHSVSSGKIGAVAPNLRRPTPGPPKFAGLWGSEMIGRGRQSLGHLDIDL